MTLLLADDHKIVRQGLRALLENEKDFSLVRKCEGEGCTLWFLDLSKAHARRWCSMAVCGNRAKAAAHRARARQSLVAP